MARMGKCQLSVYREGTQPSSLSKVVQLCPSMSVSTMPGPSLLSWLPTKTRAASTSFLHMWTGHTVLTSRGASFDCLGPSPRFLAPA